MFAVNRDEADESPGQTLKDLRGTLPVPLAVIDDWFAVVRMFRWLRDEAQHSALMRELNLLNDHCLDDLGVRRPRDQRTDDLVKRLRAGG